MEQCGLRAIPAFLGKLRSLERLDLCKYFLELGARPKLKGGIKSLRDLNLGNCYLRDSPGVWAS